MPLPFGEMEPKSPFLYSEDLYLNRKDDSDMNEELAIGEANGFTFLRILRKLDNIDTHTLTYLVA